MADEPYIPHIPHITTDPYDDDPCNVSFEWWKDDRYLVFDSNGAKADWYQVTGDAKVGVLIVEGEILNQDDAIKQLRWLGEAP